MQENNIVAKVIAGEAAGEGEIGLRAVACVIANRCKAQKRTPENIVTQPKQFSCLQLPEMMERNYQEVKEIVDILATNILELEDITSGALNYVTDKLYYSNVRPFWIESMEVTKVIGKHVFMRPRAVRV